jgi:hypothetical protein
MRWLGGTTPEARADLPDVLAPEGGACDGVRGRSASAQLDATTLGCAACDTVRGRCPRWRSHHDGRRMRAVGMASECVAGDSLPRHRMRCP